MGAATETVTCCEQPGNRVLAEKEGDLTVTRCVICNRRHFELVVDPLHINLRAAD